MKYFFTGADQTNLAKTDGRDWWVTGDDGQWMKMTFEMKEYLADGGVITAVDDPEPAFAAFFPEASWSP